MSETRTNWVRLRCAIDAITLSHLLICTLAFVVLRGSPLFALGGAFAAPIVLALLFSIGRRIRFALTGRLPGTPPQRIGQPSWKRRHNASLQLTEGPGLGSTRAGNLR